MTTLEATQRAAFLYPISKKNPHALAQRKAYIRGVTEQNNGYIDTPEEEFFTELATKLRGLWPAGNKGGIYPWRDSVPNLTARLQELWELRGLPKFTIETCLSVAQRYISKFENDDKYMQTLKYFIMRNNEKVISPDGKIHYTHRSTFADMLEGKKEEDAVQNEWEELLNRSNFGEGTIR